jgi:DNA mismatch endonuclease (patch repair protein)
LNPERRPYGLLKLRETWIVHEAIAKTMLAVFVHGCYWHGCPTCERNLTPKTNAAYWSAKIAQNQERDARNQAALEAMGYRVLVLWECEVKPKRIEEAVERVREALQKAT